MVSSFSNTFLNFANSFFWGMASYRDAQKWYIKFSVEISSFVVFLNEAREILEGPGVGQ